MGDAGISQQALHVGLGNGGQIPVDQGQGREEGHDHGQSMIKDGNALECRQEADQDNETRGLRGHREKTGDRRRSTLVDIGNPELEGEGARLETQRDDDQSDTEEEGKQRGLGQRGNRRGE